MKEFYLMSQIKSLEVGRKESGESVFHVELIEGAVSHPESEHGPQFTAGIQVWDRVRGYLAGDDKTHADYHVYANEHAIFRAGLPKELSLDELRDKIIQEFTPHWALNDSAHRIEHFLAVEECANYINDKLSLGCDPKLIMLAAFFHDLFAWSRYNHHIMSQEWVATNDHPIFRKLTHPERELVSNACGEHRASFEGAFSSTLSRLISSADRGRPGFVTDMLERSKAYHRDALKLGDEAANRGAVDHLKEKFGTGGYARFPALYEQAFGDELDHQRFLIDNLTY